MYQQRMCPRITSTTKMPTGVDRKGTVDLEPVASPSERRIFCAGLPLFFYKMDERYMFHDE